MHASGTRETLAWRSVHVEPRPALAYAPFVGRPRTRKPEPPRRSRRRLVVAGVAAALVVAALVVAGIVLAGGSDDGGGAAAAPATGLPACAKESGDAQLACYSKAFDAAVLPAKDPLAAVDAISKEAYAESGPLLVNCHGLMHAVGRKLAAEKKITLATLMDYLPKSNDPGCSAGFAHGLVTAVAPQIDVNDPKASASVCADAETRYERYSCIHGFGHAFMRLYSDQLGPALELCRKLGEQAPDCAQGAFHDYWFSVGGYDDAPKQADPVTDPAILCGQQAKEFVRPCWYRAFVDNRPAEPVTRATDLDRLCRGLAGLQREACITAAEVIGPADPRAQMALCYGYKGDDALACVRGIKAQNFLGRGSDIYVYLIQRCDGFGEDRVRLGCYRWLGKEIAVLTNGDFERSGCLAIKAQDASDACIAGAKSMNEALVTFS